MSPEVCARAPPPSLSNAEDDTGKKQHVNAVVIVYEAEVCVIALRDIMDDEEIVIWYGPAWDVAAHEDGRKKYATPADSARWERELHEVRTALSVHMCEILLAG